MFIHLGQINICSPMVNQKRFTVVKVEFIHLGQINICSPRANKHLLTGSENAEKAIDCTKKGFKGQKTFQ